MKATIKYYDQWGDKRQATLPVSADEVNQIIREAVKAGKVKRFDTVLTVKCGRTEYRWMGRAFEAFPEDMARSRTW